MTATKLPRTASDAARRRAVILCAAIRAFRARSADGASGRRDSNRNRLLTLSPARLLKYARHVPASISAGTRLLLAEVAAPGTKAWDVAAEIVAADCKVQTSPPGLGGRSRFRHWLRALGLLVHLSRRRSRIGADERAFVIAVLLARDLFAARPRAVAVVISDMSRRRLALAAGAGLAGNRVLWWQIDLHAAPIPALGFTHAAICSADGAEAAQAAGMIPVAIRQPKAQPLRSFNSLETVGLAVNVQPSANLIDYAQKIRTQLGAERLILRLHPRDPGAWIGRLPNGIILAPAREPLPAFCNRIDLVVVGNSAVQLKIALAGTPVLHLGGVDSGGFHLYGYVGEGLIYGARDLSTVDLAVLRRHGQRPGLAAALADKLALPPGLPVLAAYFGQTACPQTGQYGGQIQ